MKTLINQHGDVCRHDDDEAEKVIALNYGWEYCPKHIDKIAEGDRHARLRLAKRGARGEEAKALQTEAKKRQTKGQDPLS